MNTPTTNIPRHARASIREAGPAWHRFLAAYDAIEADGADATIEDFAEFYGQFKRLCRLGIPFSPSFATTVEWINRCNRNGDDDPDSDASDEALDMDDPDEDADDSDREPS
jgi:hypothetical protein